MKRKIITNMNKDEIVELFDKGVIFMLRWGQFRLDKYNRTKPAYDINTDSYCFEIT